MFYGHAIEIFHGDEREAFVFADFEDHADVGMVEDGSGLGFALETGEHLGVLDYIVREKFQGYVAAEGGVFGFVDDAHTAAAEFFDYAIVRNDLADHCRDAFAGDVRTGAGDSQRGRQRLRRRKFKISNLRLGNGDGKGKNPMRKYSAWGSRRTARSG